MVHFSILAGVSIAGTVFNKFNANNNLEEENVMVNANPLTDSDAFLSLLRTELTRLVNSYQARKWIL